MLAVLRLPGVRSLFAFACIGRLPMGALGLLMILQTHELTDSFASGGVVAAAYIIALGISNPALARVVDRVGQAIVLRAGAVVSASAMAAFAIVPEDAGTGALIACAAVAGAAQPPIGACMRSLWPVLAPDADLRHAAYALEGAAGEIIYILGPVAIVGGIGSWSLQAGLFACALAILIGDTLFSLHPASRGWRPPEHAERHLLGALRGPGVLVLIVVFALCGLAVGAVEVAVPATLEPLGKEKLTGLLLGLWGVGSLLTALVVARAGAASDPPRRLAVLLVGWGVAHAALALATGPASLGALLLLAGASISPVLVYANAMLDYLAPLGTLAEAFTWTTTGLTAGMAVGAALGGVLAERASPSVAFAVLGGGGALAAVVVQATANGPLRPAVVA
ncbi:MAG TPA: MFS transporter [Solirubrobacteraceae bacterium]|nr:MFS transporter [Solirubrobacteraceae bacterium]